MKLARYQKVAKIRSGLVVGDRVLDVAQFTGDERHSDMSFLLTDWENVGSVLARVVDSKVPDAATFELSSVRLLAPVSRPGAIYCAGANYSDHIAEMRNGAQGSPESEARAAGLQPWHFIKSSHTVVGPGTAVALPPGASKVDWEAELAVVIGRRAKGVSVDSALDFVAGYTIANDLSARDLSRRRPLPESSPFYYDWTGQKSFDGSCPLGPWIATAEIIPDPNLLSITLRVNNEVKQCSSTKYMIFNVAEQISHLARHLTLWPGDIILTGTPAGVGVARNEFLKPGDRISITIERLGELEHSVR